VSNLRCHHGSKLRIRWHDSIVREFVSLAKLAGADVVSEPAGIMLHTDDRPDLALRDSSGHFRVITDVRTAVATVDGVCPGAAATPGHAAASIATGKDTKWLPQAAAQGLRFYALVIECGGRLGVGAFDFVSALAAKAGGSSAERDAFTTYALQRLRAISMKGTCDIVIGRTPLGAVPRVPRRVFLPLGQPMPRPAATRPRGIPPPVALSPLWQRAQFQAPPILLFPEPVTPTPGLTWQPVPQPGMAHQPQLQSPPAPIWQPTPLQPGPIWPLPLALPLLLPMPLPVIWQQRQPPPVIAPTLTSPPAP
jgi:hypothetical protein